MKWNSKAHSAMVSKYPELQSKAESVALAVRALEDNPNMSPDDWRKLSKSSGLRIAGRAVGSAREILGMSPATKKKTASKRGPGRPRGSKNVTKRSASVANAESLGDIVAMIRDIEKERDRAVSTLRKVRDLLDAAI